MSSLAQGLTDDVLDYLGLPVGGVGSTVVWAVGVSLGLAASVLLLFVMFRLLGEPRVHNRALWRGALLGAVAFEILKLLVIYVLGSVGGSAFAPLAIAITLVVWINYFSRLVMYGASWAYTSEPTAATQVAVAEGDQVPESAGVVSVRRTTEDESPKGRFDPGSAVVGAVAGAVVAKLLSRGE